MSSQNKFYFRESLQIDSDSEERRRRSLSRTRNEEDYYMQQFI